MGRRESLHWYTFSWKPGMSYSQMLSILAKESAGIELAEGRVPHTMMYGFLGDQIVGRVSLRHQLNQALARRGGHIGYAVAKKYRRRGFGGQFMAAALEFFRILKTKSVMITCADENEASWRIVERFGAKLEEKFYDDVDKEMTRKYWIDLLRAQA